jgi:hypothetical protein
MSVDACKHTRARHSTNTQPVSTTSDGERQGHRQTTIMPPRTHTPFRSLESRQKPTAKDWRKVFPDPNRPRPPLSAARASEDCASRTSDDTSWVAGTPTLMANSGQRRRAQGRGPREKGAGRRTDHQQRQSVWSRQKKRDRGRGLSSRRIKSNRIETKKRKRRRSICRNN